MADMRTVSKGLEIDSVGLGRTPSGGGRIFGFEADPVPHPNGQVLASPE